MFVGLFVFYILIHIALIIWLFCVPYRRRREMEYFDKQYAAKKHIMIIEPTRTRYVSIQTQPTDVIYHRASIKPGQQHLSPIKSPMRALKHSDGLAIMTNATNFLPIKEETEDIPYHTITSTEVHEHDEVFYNDTPTMKTEAKTVSVQV